MRVFTRLIRRVRVSTPWIITVMTVRFQFVLFCFYRSFVYVLYIARQIFTSLLLLEPAVVFASHNDRVYQGNYYLQILDRVSRVFLLAPLCSR